MALRECEKPFLVRAIWHDGQFTYLKSEAAGAAGALRGEGWEAGASSISGVQRHRYVVPKVLGVGLSRRWAMRACRSSSGDDSYG